MNSLLSILKDNTWNKLNRTNSAETIFWWTQVGSPAMRFRLARCTAWVKRWSEAMDFLLTTYFQNKYLLIGHLWELYYNKGLDVPSSIPLIIRGFSSHPYMMKELRLPLDFSSTLFKIFNMYYFISNIFYFKKEGWWGVKVVRLGQMRRTFTRMHIGTLAPNF